MTPDDRKRLGADCEALAARYLLRKGLRLHVRNYRTRLGEIDLICEDRGTLVFVEVKARRGDGFGDASEAVGWRKQQRIMAVAQLYLAGQPERRCRFDVVAIDVGRGRPRIRHIQDAFP